MAGTYRDTCKEIFGIKTHQKLYIDFGFSSVGDVFLVCLWLEDAFNYFQRNFISLYDNVLLKLFIKGILLRVFFL